MKITMEEAAKKLMAAQRVLITAHVNPDGDAVGASLGLAALLREKGKTATVVLDDKLPRNLAFLPGYDEIRRPDGTPPDVDLLVVLDADPDRVGDALKGISGVPLLNIDHHITNKQTADFYYIENRAATAEMIYDIAEHLASSFPKAMALALYTGLSGDTGSFRFSNTRPSTFRAAARLLEAGAEPHVVSENFEVKPLSVFEGQVAALRTLEMTSGGRVAGLYLDQELTAKLESSEGFIDMIRVIEGVEAAVLIRALEPARCRVSIRSKGLDVTRVATKFGGGGHVRAAGCTLEMPLAEAKRAIQTALDELLASS
ncbi:MAG: bifunctional oligoribonuclease/PAP phosphatase NrnA [Schwartzia sp.]|nr:bifunctional oligoribonuclease/PAP phosphatase NrnA [Schwartzia sp. (in: firmicutes)]